jgi:hypothetical protein
VHVLATRVSNGAAKVPMGSWKCLSPLASGDTIWGSRTQFAQVQTAGDDAYVLFTEGGSFYPGSFYPIATEVLIESGLEGSGAAGRHRPNPE